MEETWILRAMDKMTLIRTITSCRRKGETNMFAPKNILVPTDYSDYADKALRKALEIAKQFKSRINLLHVNNAIPECAGDYCVDYATLRKVREQIAEGTQEAMKAEVAKFNEFKDTELSYDIREGIPYDEILKDQEEKEIDLIVIASRGKRGLTKHRLGHTAERVLRDAKCSVLLVRDEGM
jgi:nucleotide-binding universal stress UspA family protein